METRSGLFCLKNLNILSNRRRQLGLKNDIKIYIVNPPLICWPCSFFFCSPAQTQAHQKAEGKPRARESYSGGGLDHKALSWQCLFKSKAAGGTKPSAKIVCIRGPLRSTISRNDNRVIVKVSTGEGEVRITGSSFRIVCSVNIVICLVNLVRPKGLFSSGTLALRRSEESNPSSTY